MPRNQCWIVVDVEGSWRNGKLSMREFGAVDFDTRSSIHLYSSPESAHLFADWVKRTAEGLRPVFWSDNPAFDWQFIEGMFREAGVPNPFGWSARRIGDLYAGLVGNPFATSDWKSLRVTLHDHNPVNDAMGNVEALARMLSGERANGLGGPSLLDLTKKGES